MALALSLIPARIAAVSVAGLTIKDVSGIPEAWDGRAPILYPNPVEFVTDLSIEDNSFGLNPYARKTLSYTLNYTFLHSAVWTGRINFPNYAAMVEMAADILYTFARTEITGALSFEVSAGNFGPVSDPSGNIGHGCNIQFAIMEFIN